MFRGLTGSHRPREVLHREAPGAAFSASLRTGQFRCSEGCFVNHGPWPDQSASVRSQTTPTARGWGSYGDADTKRKALENGAETLFTKPIDFGALRGEIDLRIERAA